MLLSRLATPLVLASAGILGGCYATVQPEPVYATTEVTAAPVDVETRPTAVYEGRVVYWANDHWYYRDRGRWSYYREEPPQLRQRHYVEHAPPAPRGYEAPASAPRGYAPPASAPPAVRVQ